MSVPFPCWVAFRRDTGRPVGFANANYVAGEDFRGDYDDDIYEVRLVADQAERDGYLDVHKAGAS